jgi:hypothetical protein
MTSQTHFLSDQAHVTLFLVSTALTSSMQPLLYAYAVLKERGRQARRGRLLKALLAKSKDAARTRRS